MQDYLKIKYSNSCDIGGSVFSATESAFYYTLFLPYDLGEGSYELTEKGREDGDGSFIPDIQRLQKKYNIKMVVPEYLYDALCHIPLHDIISVSTKFEENSRAFNFAVELNEWIRTQDNMPTGVAKVTITFSVDYTINSGCCDNEQVIYQHCVVCNPKITVVDWIADTDPIYTDPDASAVNCFAYYLVGHLVNGELVNNDLLQYNTKENGWIKYPGRQFEAVCFTDSGTARYFYYDDSDHWHIYQALISVANSGTNIIVKGYCLPNTWVQVQVKPLMGAWTNAGAITYGSTFESAGVSVPGLTPTVSYQVRFNMYNNNCNYGYSDIMTIVKT